MANFKLNVNGEIHNIDVDPSTPILCGIAQCGACSIHLNSMAVRSCQLPVASVGNGNITTIEGLSENGDHPVQKAWIENDVPQCGYCQSGQIMQAASLLKSNPNPTDEEIESAMDGNLCRCGTYIRIKKAIKRAVKS